MSRPKIKIQSTKTDWVLEAIGIIGIILSLLAVMLSYNDLPDTIPRHYNFTGRPDGYGEKSILFILLALAILTYLIMTFSLRFPHLFNYPFEITEENAERQYKNSALLVRALKIIVTVIFGYLTYATIQNGLGKMHGLGTWFTPVTLLVMLGTVGYFIYKGFRLR